MQYRLGDISYVLTASEYLSGFYGQWRCDRCGIAGMYPTPVQTAAEALEKAKLDLQSHQNESHRAQERGR